MHIQTEHERTLEFMKNNPCCLNIIDEIPQDMPTSNVDENGVWREDEYRRLHPEKFDSVNHPAHYESGEMPVIEIIESVIDGLDSKQAFFLGNVIKYVIRAGKKGDIHEDLAKANNYAHRLCSGHWRWEGGQNE